MILTAQNVLTRARDVAQDAGAVYWPEAESINWMNDGRAVMYEVRPDIYERTETVSLLAGYEQKLPGNSTRLFDVLSNVSSAKRRRITKIEAENLDRVAPNWRSEAVATEILHFMYDPNRPDWYEVYPPAALGVQVRIRYARLPTAIPSSMLGTQLDNESALATCLVDYILHRYFAKESDTNPGFNERSAMHMTLFRQALGVQQQNQGAKA